MSKLYPIGTQLITRRLSQAALAHELGFVVESSSLGLGNEFEDDFHVGTDDFDMPWNNMWRVTVTPENQKWLSPVPMVGDKIQYHEYSSYDGSVYVSNIVSFIDYDILDLKADQFTHTFTDAATNKKKISIYQVYDILKRTYPNGQRAPMLEWDEVIEQAVGERK